MEKTRAGKHLMNLAVLAKNAINSVPPKKRMSYYKDFIEGSRSNMFPIQNLITSDPTADFTFSLTQMVFSLYQQYLGTDLVGENLEHFNQAVLYQHQGIQDFIDTKTPEGYLSSFTNAYEEYQQIHL